MDAGVAGQDEGGNRTAGAHLQAAQYRRRGHVRLDGHAGAARETRKGTNPFIVVAVEKPMAFPPPGNWSNFMLSPCCIQEAREGGARKRPRDELPVQSERDREMEEQVQQLNVSQSSSRLKCRHQDHF